MYLKPLILLILQFIMRYECSESDSVHRSTAVPVISVSMNTDPKNYVPRLIRSIDHEVGLFVLQVGNKDPKIVENIINNTVLAVNRNTFIKSYQIKTLNYNPGQYDIIYH